MKLTAKGISRRFFRNARNSNYFYAVEKTDLDLEEGKITVLIGRSGSGKTTLINMLAGVLTPTEGSVMLDGQDIYKLSDTDRSITRCRHIGYIPQGQTGLQSLTVLENVLAPSVMYPSNSDQTKYAHELLNAMRIDDLSDIYSNELSGGELRRMSIARALINSPEIIIADEPTADLDNDTTSLVLGLFRQLADNGASVLIVTHESDVLSYADRVCKMDKGILKISD